MPENTPQPIEFTVAVDISTQPATYTIYQDGQPVTDDSVTVTVGNTHIVYTLIPNQDDLIFVDPTITNDPAGDISYQIKDEKQVLELLDTDVDQEDICLILNVAQASTPTVIYPSPDPQIKNKPPS